jgi:hypothetical protein
MNVYRRGKIAGKALIGMRASEKRGHPARGRNVMSPTNDDLIRQLEEAGVIDPRTKPDPAWEQAWEGMETQHLEALLAAKQRFDELLDQQDTTAAWPSWWGIIK